MPRTRHRPMIEVFVHHVLTVPVPEAEHDIAVMTAALNARKEVHSLNPRKRERAATMEAPAPPAIPPAEPAQEATPPPVRDADGQTRPAQPKRKRVRNRRKVKPGNGAEQVEQAAQAGHPAAAPLPDQVNEEDVALPLEE
jgi:hypothetical protein